MQSVLKISSMPEQENPMHLHQSISFSLGTLSHIILISIMSSLLSVMGVE